MWKVLLAACSILPLMPALLLAELATTDPDTADPATAEPATIEWQVTTRDVYVDSELRPGATILRAREPNRLAVLLSDADSVWLATERDEETTVEMLPASAFEFGEPQTATTVIEPQAVNGTFTKVGDARWLSVAEHDILLVPHSGPSGPLGIADIWRTVPLWRQLYGAYQPDTESVEVLRGEQRSLRLLVAFGTWCGDSRRSVPRLLKTLDEASNPRLDVELVAIDRTFTEPLDRVRELQITNVPTIIVFQGDQEIGRFVENPHGEFVEQDIAAIVGGQPLAPSEKLRDEDQLIAEGWLERQDGEAREEWRLYSTEDDQHRLYVERHDGGGRTEIWQRIDGDGATAFVEITRTGDAEHSRTRWGRDGQRWRSTTRGDVTGIVRQAVDLPPSSIVSLPSLVATGMACQRLADGGEAPSMAYVASGVGMPAPGSLQAIELRRVAEEGEQVRCELEVAGHRTTLWLDPASGAPWKVESGDERWRQIEE